MPAVIQPSACHFAPTNRLRIRVTDDLLAAGPAVGVRGDWLGAYRQLDRSSSASGQSALQP